LRTAVEERRNILVAGGTSPGKTTLANALLAEVAKSSDRVVLIADTRVLQCLTPSLVSLRTKDGIATLSDLVSSALRLRPDRIPIGEVRGAEALDSLPDLQPVSKIMKFSRRTFTSALAAGPFVGLAAPSRLFAKPTGSSGRVVIVGGGFGGATCAKYLRRANHALDITLVEQNARYPNRPHLVRRAWEQEYPRDRGPRLKRPAKIRHYRQLKL